MRNPEFLYRGSRSAERGQSWRTCLQMTFAQQAHCLRRMSVWGFLGGVVFAHYEGGGSVSLFPKPPSALPLIRKDEG